MSSLPIAIVQIDYQPAYVQAGKDFLCEPISPFQSDKYPGLFELETALLAQSNASSSALQQVKQWRETIRASYEQWLHSKLKIILEFLHKKDVAIVLFPEYSIPCSLLPFLRQYFPSGIIIAGTHSVGSHCTCADLGFAVSASDIGRAFCPIFMPDGKVHTIHKIGLSKWEADNLPGDLWDPVRVNLSLDPIVILARICIDFITDNSYWRSKEEEIEGARNEAGNGLRFIHAVPALTPQLDDFINHATEKAKRHDEVVLFANGAAGGGSKIYFDNPNGHRALQDRLGSWTASREEEVIIIAELDSKVHLRPRNFTSVPTPPPPVRQTAIVPFHYYSGAGTLDRIAELLTTNTPDMLREILKQELENVPTTGPQPSLYAKLRELRHRLQDSSNSEIAMLSELLIIPPEVPSMDEWRYRALFATAKQLENISGSTSAHELCCDFAAKFRKLASETAYRTELGYTLEQLGTIVTPPELLDESLNVATRLLSAPSSGEVEMALLEWIDSSLSNRTAMGTNISKIRKTVKLLETSRPYPMKSTVSRLRKAISQSHDPESLTRATCKEIREERDRARRKLIDVGNEAKLVAEGDHLLLYGYSSSVLSILRAFSQFALPQDITLAIPECRNRFGVDSAPRQIKQLTLLGFKCRFVTAESIGRYITTERPKSVLVGANALVPDGIINTMGSLAVANLSRSASIDVQVIAPTYKIWSPEFWQAERVRLLGMQRPTDHNLPEWVHHLPGVSLVSFAYDLVPFSLVSKIISDKGIIDSKSAPQMFVE